MKTALLTPILLFLSVVAFAQDQEYHLDENYKIDKRGRITLSSDDANVTIKGSNRNDVRVKVDRKVVVKGVNWGSREFEVDVEERDGNLYIRERSRGNVSIAGYMREDYRILIEAPHGVSLDIEGDDDDYQISDIEGSIHIDVDDGDAELRNCSGESFRFNIDDGDIMMDQGAGSLYVRADDGDVKILNAHFSEINATVDDGDLEIETSLDDNGDYFIRGNDSDIALAITAGGGDFNISHDDSRISSSREFSVIQKSERKTNLKLAKGNAKFEIRTDDGHIRLDAN